MYCPGYGLIRIGRVLLLFASIPSYRTD
jgi:hypothetical protein